MGTASHLCPTCRIMACRGGTWMILPLPVPAPEFGGPKDEVSLELEILSPKM